MVKISSKVLNRSRSSSKCEWMQMSENNILRLLKLAGVWGTQLEQERVTSILISHSLCALYMETNMEKICHQSTKVEFRLFLKFHDIETKTKILQFGWQEMGGALHRIFSTCSFVVFWSSRLSIVMWSLMCLNLHIYHLTYASKYL